MSFDQRDEKNKQKIFPQVWHFCSRQRKMGKTSVGVSVCSSPDSQAHQDMMRAILELFRRYGGTWRPYVFAGKNHIEGEGEGENENSDRKCYLFSKQRSGCFSYNL